MKSADRGGNGHLVESRPARLVGERTAGMVGSGPGADGRQRWIRAVDLRLASGSDQITLDDLGYDDIDE
jgi:hypothetical protein